VIDLTMQVGEAYVGEGDVTAHVNTVLGWRSGPVGTAWAAALAQPSAGHTPFVAVLCPGVPTKPPTLFVNKATITSDLQAELTWGAAQAGVAWGVAAAVAEEIIPHEHLDELVAIAAVWVNPAATDADALFDNNARATLEALRHGRDGIPSLGDVLTARATPWNAYFRPQKNG
jgi:5,6,7,8-tetrahydromethanopterin hydro-lyase